MPKTIMVGPNDNFRLPPTATPEQKAAWEKIKGERPRMLPYVTAMENITRSGNMYRTIVEDPMEPMAPGPRLLDDYGMDELKVMLVSLGIKTEKQMKKADVLRLIRSRLDEVEIVDDEDDA